MRARRFGRTGFDVSPVGFGGAEIGFLPSEGDAVARLLNTVLDVGINVIDTAAMYHASEVLIGNAISTRRDEYVLISKCGTEVDDIDAPAWSPELITGTVDRALGNLKTDRLDVMLLHSCDREVLDQGDALGALIDARDAGKIRHVGYSGDNETVAHAATLPEVAVIETSINICDQRNIDVVLPACRQHDVGVIIKRPMANAAWKPLDTQPGTYANYARTYTERLARMDLTPAMCGFDGDGDWPALALQFALAHDGGHTAIIGTTNERHVRSNVAAATADLAADAVARIRDAYRVAEAAADDGPWLGQT